MFIYNIHYNAQNQFDTLQRNAIKALCCFSPGVFQTKQVHLCCVCRCISVVSSHWVCQTAYCRLPLSSQHRTTPSKSTQLDRYTAHTIYSLRGKNPSIKFEAKLMYNNRLNQTTGNTVGNDARI
jgi:hypothetical protein